MDILDAMRMAASAGYSGLPPQDELIRPPAPNFRAPMDFRLLAQPYRGPQTGDPVINRPQIGTYDRAPTMLTPELRHQIRNPPYTQMPVSYNLGLGNLGALF